MFEPPPKTRWNVLSLGAGVQSTTLALMAAKGDIGPMPDFAVFADTHAEPAAVYQHLAWLKTQLPFPVYMVEKGDLTKAQLTPTKRKKPSKTTGEPAGSTYLKKLIPVFGQYPDGGKSAAIGRKCTADFKIIPIIKMLREKCGIKRGQKEVTVTQWIGISWDEMQRMKDARDSWMQSRWPLIEKQMRRRDCIQWMRDNDYPEPPRSACYYCPFHSDADWRRMRDEDPEHFQKAIDFDKQYRDASQQHDKSMRMSLYLHRSCKPLDEVDFDSDEDKGQQVWDFQAECEGMCGI